MSRKGTSKRKQIKSIPGDDAMSGKKEILDGNELKVSFAATLTNDGSVKLVPEAAREAKMVKNLADEINKYQHPFAGVDPFNKVSPYARERAGYGYRGETPAVADEEHTDCAFGDRDASDPPGLYHEDYAIASGTLPAHPGDVQNNRIISTPAAAASMSGLYPIPPSGGQPVFRNNIGAVPKAKKKVMRDDWGDDSPAKLVSPSRPLTSRIISNGATEDREDFDDLRNSLVINKVADTTILYAIVVDKENDGGNIPQSVPCQNGVGFGGYVYDRANDAYLVNCVTFVSLASLPFGFVVSLPQLANWRVSLPTPVGVIHRHLSPQQRGIVEDLEKQFPAPRFEVQYIQMAGCR